MNAISCIVVDDEPLAVRLMESYVAKTPFLSLKGSFTSGTAAYSFLQDNPVDLLFCDIQMPNLSGMELSRMLPERTRIIFTTAFSEYAVEGFKVRALDYLLKPISYEDFLSAVLRAKEYLELIDYKSLRQAQRPSGLVTEPAVSTLVTEPAVSTSVTEPVEVTEQRKIKSIFVKTEYRLQQIDLDRITYIEGLKDYVKIHLNDGTVPILSLMRLKALEDTLPKEDFVRVHKSFIVVWPRLKPSNATTSSSALHAFLSETPIRQLYTKPFPVPSSFLAAKDEGRGTQLIEYECKKQCRGVAGCTTKPFF